MMKYPFDFRRVFGLIGEPRAGKDSVAKYLQETRDFTSFAFADKIKEEYGISKEDFEAAKITGNIEEMRDDLWSFSDKVKKKDPFYFINKVMEDIANTKGSAVITDIRTPDELNAFFSADGLRRRAVYFVMSGKQKRLHKNDEIISETKLLYRDVFAAQSGAIYNKNKGMIEFYDYLNRFFMEDDIRTLVNEIKEFGEGKGGISYYLENYNIYPKL